MLTSIILPVYNQHEFSDICIESIIKNNPKGSYEIIVIDNFSDPPYSHPYIDILIRNEENLGFPKAINQGVTASNKDSRICISNNDLVFTENFFERLNWHLDNGLDLVGPCTNSISGPQQVWVPVYDGIEELNQTANKFYEDNKHKHFPFYRLVGFCLLVKREVIEKIGMLDLDFGMGNFEDDSYCLAAIKAGFKCGIAQDCYLHHVGGMSFKQNEDAYINLMKKNKKIFDSKWDIKTIKELALLNEKRVNEDKR